MVAVAEEEEVVEAADVEAAMAVSGAAVEALHRSRRRRPEPLPPSREAKSRSIERGHEKDACSYKY